MKDMERYPAAKGVTDTEKFLAALLTQAGGTIRLMDESVARTEYPGEFVLYRDEMRMEYVLKYIPINEQEAVEASE